MSNVRSNFLGESKIFNNFGIEIDARGDAFPRFDGAQANVQPFPNVSSTTEHIIPGWHDYYFLATGHFTPPIPVGNIVIDRSDPSKFFPNLASFNFNTGLEGVSQSYELLKDLLQQHLFEQAFTVARDDIIPHPNTYYAVSAISMLPFIFSGKGASCCELFNFLTDIDAERLQQTTLETIALARMGRAEYYESILLFQRIVDNPPGELEQLLAELHIAFASLRLAEAGGRSIPAVSSRTASARSEFLAIERDIMDRINRLHNRVQDDDNVIEVPEVYEFAVSNFPNPFNPYTTIQFTIGDVGNVVINVYNVRGQRVRTLLNDYREPGHHSVIWNGTDDSGRALSSGIYLYRIVAGENKATRRMLLMK